MHSDELLYKSQPSFLLEQPFWIHIESISEKLQYPRCSELAIGFSTGSDGLGGLDIGCATTYNHILGQSLKELWL